jgi:hypothetical protein
MIVSRPINISQLKFFSLNPAQSEKRFKLFRLKWSLFLFIFALFVGNYTATAQPAATWNYSFRTGNIGTDYSWIDCSTGTSVVFGDDVEGSLPWPFTFKFYDITYTTLDNLSVTDNGFVRLDGTATTNGKTADKYNLASTSTELGQIVGLAILDNKVGDNGGYCNYLLTGTEPNRVLTIEYFNVEINSRDNKFATVQVSFYETSNKVVLKFANENIQRRGADMGIHSGVAGFFNKWGEVNGFTANTWIEYSPSASLIAAPKSIAFGYVAEGLISTEQTFSLTGSDLNNPPGNISVNAPANFEVSLSSGTGFSSNINVPFSSSTLAATAVYVRFTPTAADVDYSGNIDISGGGAGPQTVFVSGTSAVPGYCTFSFNTVKPITRLNISNLDYIDRNTANRNSYEDYSISVSPATIFTGGTFAVTVEGVANNFETLSYTAFFDWNQDGDFIDAGESFPIGTISNSNGNDGKQAITNIIVPKSNIALGNTRMRIIGDNEGYSGNPCSSNKNKSNGQIQDYTVNIANPGFIWRGTTNNDWNTASNWSDGVVPGENDDVTLPAAVLSGNWPVISTNVGSIRNLDIQSGASGTGSLIINGGSLIVSGQISAEQYVPSDDWHIISSPVSGQQIGSFASNNNLGFYDGAYDIAPYSESGGDWGPFNVVAATATQFERSAGYLSRLPLGDGNRNIAFLGNSVYSGTINQSISYANNGWNCVGNPYTSALKLTGPGSFLEVNAANGNLYPDFNGIYIWNHAIWDYDVYSASTPLTVPMGQGFVLKSKNGGGTVQFTPAMQLHSSVVLKSDEIQWPYIRLKIWSPEIENSTLIHFNSGMTEGLDEIYDIGKLKGNPDIALYTRTLENDNLDLAIQALPTAVLEDVVIPIGLDCAVDGEFEFDADIEGLPEHVEVILEDKKEKRLTILSEGKNYYTTNIEAGQSGIGRFFLILKSNSTITKTKAKQEEFKVFTRNKTILIDGPSNHFTTFSLYGVDGKKWISQNATSINRNKIDAADYPAGIYFLRIVHEGKHQTEKLVLID